MAIAVEHEDVEALKAWGLGLEVAMERCVFCAVETRYWYKMSTPVCACCALVKEEVDVIAAKAALRKQSALGRGFMTRA